MMEHFRNKPFILFQSQGFPSCNTDNALDIKESVFKRTVRFVKIYDVPWNANFTSIHVLYKVNMLEDHYLNQKSRISTPRNE